MPVSRGSGTFPPKKYFWRNFPPQKFFWRNFPPQTKNFFVRFFGGKPILRHTAPHRLSSHEHLGTKKVETRLNWANWNFLTGRPKAGLAKNYNLAAAGRRAHPLGHPPHFSAEKSKKICGGENSVFFGRWGRKFRGGESSIILNYTEIKTWHQKYSK